MDTALSSCLFRTMCEHDSTSLSPQQHTYLLVSLCSTTAIAKILRR